MKKLIHKYLNRVYRINQGFIQELESSEYIIIYSDELVRNIGTIFPLTTKQLKWYIKDWVLNQDRNFNFNRWWANKRDLHSVTVLSGTRTIRATWTPELAQDLSAFHSIDVEAELTAILSQELAIEMGRNTINQLINNTPMPRALEEVVTE